MPRGVASSLMHKQRRAALFAWMMRCAAHPESEKARADEVSKLESALSKSASDAQAAQTALLTKLESQARAAENER